MCNERPTTHVLHKYNLSENPSFVASRTTQLQQQPSALQCVHTQSCCPHLPPLDPQLQRHLGCHQLDFWRRRLSQTPPIDHAIGDEASRAPARRAASQEQHYCQQQDSRLTEDSERPMHGNESHNRTKSIELKLVVADLRVDMRSWRGPGCWRPQHAVDVWLNSVLYCGPTKETPTYVNNGLHDGRSYLVAQACTVEWSYR